MRPHGRLGVALAACAAVLAGIFVAGVGTAAASIGVLAAGGIAAIATVASCAGGRGVVVVLWFAAAVLAPWNGIRIADGVAIGDPVVLLAVGAAFLTSRASPWRTVTVSWVGFALLTSTGLIATIAVAGGDSGLGYVVRFVAVALLVPTSLAAFAPSPNELRLILGGYVVGAVTTAGVAFLQAADGVVRPSGLESHFNHLGLVAVMGIGVVVGLAPGLRRAGAVVAATVVVILLGAITVSGSRAGLIGAAVVWGVYVSLDRRRPVVAASLAVAATLAILAVAAFQTLPPGNALERLLLDGGDAAGSDAARVEVLGTAFDQALSSPLIGSGFDMLRDAHDIYLQIIVTSGLIGLIGFSIALASIVTPAIQAARDLSAAPHDRALAAGLAAAVAGFLAVGLFQNALWDRYIWIVLAAAVAIGPAALAPGFASLRPHHWASPHRPPA